MQCFKPGDPCFFIFRALVTLSVGFVEACKSVDSKSSSKQVSDVFLCSEELCIFILHDDAFFTDSPLEPRNQAARVKTKKR